MVRVESAMPRVRMIISRYPPVVGGAERQCALLASALVRRGVELEVLTGRWRPGTPRRELRDGVRVERHLVLGLPGSDRLLHGGTWPYVATLALRLRDGWGDLWHVHQAEEAAWLASRMRGKRPLLVKLAASGPDGEMERFESGRRGPFRARMLRALLDSPAHFVAVNAALEEELRSRGVPVGRIHRIPNGVAIGPVASPPEAPPVRLVFTGRLAAQKRLDLLLEALAPLAGWRLELAGDGPERARLERLARGLELEGRVAFLGEVDHVGEVLARSHAFVLPSRSEGISNALLEAMAAGLAPVVSRIPGNEETVEDGESGLLVAPGDVEAWREALGRLVGSADLRARLGEGARRRAGEEFSIERVADGYLALYRELLGEEARA